jgi:hypothetical protein
MHVIHSDGRAYIDQTVAVLDGVTYPLSAIMSLEMREIKRRSWRMRRWVCFLVGVPLFMGVAILSAYAPASPSRDPDQIRWLIGVAVFPPR